jgi:4-amino-4-deoxychorismate lyase
MNGEFIPQEDAVVSIFDHGFMYGLGLFETFRVYDGHPFLLDDHLQRLNDGLKQLNMKKFFTREEVNEIIQRLLTMNGLVNAYIRFNVSAGSGAIGLQTAPYTNPTIIMYIKALPKAGALIEKNGELLSIPRNTPEGNSRLKSHHYLNNILAKREIGETIETEGIFLTKEGFLAEGITTNLFWIKNQSLYTPSLDTGILNGITRELVFILAKKHDLEVKEGLFYVKELQDAEEVFCTNSIQEIIPIKKMASTIFKGVHGKYVQIFHQEYRRISSSMWTINELGGVDT